jgi:hypothetical protein
VIPVKEAAKQFGLCEPSLEISNKQQYEYVQFVKEAAKFLKRTVAFVGAKGQSAKTKKLVSRFLQV